MIEVTKDAMKVKAFNAFFRYTPSKHISALSLLYPDNPNDPRKLSFLDTDCNVT